MESRNAGADHRLAATPAVTNVCCAFCSHFGDAFSSVEIRCEDELGAKAPVEVVDRARHVIAANETFIVKIGSDQVATTSFSRAGERLSR